MKLYCTPILEIIQLGSDAVRTSEPDTFYGENFGFDVLTNFED